MRRATHLESGDTDLVVSHLFVVVSRHPEDAPHPLDIQLLNHLLRTVRGEGGGDATYEAA